MKDAIAQVSTLLQKHVKAGEVLNVGKDHNGVRVKFRDEALAAKFSGLNYWRHR